MKTVLKILGIVLLIIAGFVAWVLLTLDADELGQKILVMVNNNSGVELNAERFEVKPLQGVNLENGTFQGQLESGNVSGRLDRMVFDYELLPILRGEVVVHQILVEGPALTVISQPAASEKSTDPRPSSEVEPAVAEVPSTPDADEPGFVSSVSISQIRVTEGQLSVTTEGSEAADLTVQGFDLDLSNLALDSTAPSPVLGFVASGGISIDEIRLDDMTVRGGRGQLAVDRGNVGISDLGIETSHASLEIAELAIDISQDPAPYRLQAGGSYDLDSLVEAEGDGFGPASLELSAAGTGPDIDDLVGEGTFRLEDGKIPPFPMIVKIEKLLGRSLIVGYPYQGTDIVFSIVEGRLVIEPFAMGFENLQMAGGGTVDLSGPIDLQIDVRVPRGSVSSSILDPFIDGMTDAEGWTTIPFDISGTMDAPDVDFDMTAIKETATAMGKRAVSKAVDSALDGLKNRTRRRDKDDG